MIKCLKVCTECIATVYFKKLKNLRKKVQNFFCTKNPSKKVHVLFFVLKISVKKYIYFFFLYGKKYMLKTIN
ncbi:unnamed protein product [Blepharisma stoltei]|uniref:Uncharacterized protein n=1 Tax=Blepharisma stoltei TaxID=1481888 RepID=A0AAU9JQA4_9CILI|nr:unnamed protein product [Blepharisma stoltei]